jgi:paraquat-inducible protein B
MASVFVTQASAAGNWQKQPAATRPPQLQQLNQNQSQKMLDMTQMLDRMNKLVNQLHRLHQTAEQQLQGDQSPEYSAYLNHMKDLETSMGEVGEHMKATIDRYNLLIQDRARVKNVINEGDLTALHAQLDNLSTCLEKTGNILESMNDHLVAMRDRQ